MRRATADPVVHEQGDVGVLQEVDGLFRGGVRGHDYEGSGEGELGGVVDEGVGGEVGVVHEADVGPVV